MDKSTRFAIDYGHANIPDVSNPSEQSKKSSEAARALECDDGPQRFRERVGKLVKHKSVEKLK